MNSLECPACGGAVETVRVERPVTMGARTVTVEYEVNHCAACDEDFLTPAQIDSMQQRAADAIRDREGLLRPDEIKRIRKLLGYSQARLEQVLGTGEKTVARWERGTVCQSAVADRTLRFFAAYPQLIGYYRHATDADPTQPLTQIQFFNRSAFQEVSETIMMMGSTNMNWVAYPLPGALDVMASRVAASGIMFGNYVTLNSFVQGGYVVNTYQVNDPPSVPAPAEKAEKVRESKPEAIAANSNLAMAA